VPALYSHSGVGHHVSVAAEPDEIAHARFLPGHVRNEARTDRSAGCRPGRLCDLFLHRCQGYILAADLDASAVHALMPALASTNLGLTVTVNGQQCQYFVARPQRKA